MAISFLDDCGFTATSSGTVDFVVNAVLAGGYQSPTNAAAVNGAAYRYRAYSADQSQWEIGYGAFNTGTSTLARTTVLYNSSGTTSKISFTLAPNVIMGLLLAEDVSATPAQGTNDTSMSTAAYADRAGAQSPNGFSGTIVVSASAGALTAAIKTLSGADPSVANPVYATFRNNTLTGGDYVTRAITAATSVVLGSTKTLGVTSADAINVWFTLHDNAGTVQMGAFLASDRTGYWRPDESQKYTTAVPGSASKTLYTTSAIGTAAPILLIGYAFWSSLTTAGTWTAPTGVKLMGPGVAKPGDVLQEVLGTFSATTSTSSTTFVTSGLTAAITLNNPASLVRASAFGVLRASTASAQSYARMARTSNSNLFGTQATLYSPSGAPLMTSCALKGFDKPNSASALTYYTMISVLSGAATVIWGDSAESDLFLEELQG